VDGKVLPAHPEEMLTKGSFHRLPTIVGQTKEEGAFFYRRKTLDTFLLDFIQLFYKKYLFIVTLNTMNSGRYDDRFIDQLPRLLPIMSEMDRKLLPLTRAIRRKYFRNVDLDQEDEFRPKYVEVCSII